MMLKSNFEDQLSASEHLTLRLRSPVFECRLVWVQAYMLPLSNNHYLQRAMILELKSKEPFNTFFLKKSVPFQTVVATSDME